MNTHPERDFEDCTYEGIGQLARVVALAEDGAAWVEQAGGACGRCHEAAGCGKAHLTRMFGGIRRLRVKNPVCAKPGDEVILTLPAGVLFRQSVLAYLWPLAALLLGALTGKFLADEVGALAGGVSAFGAALWLMPKIWARYLANPAFAPKIGKIVVSSPGGNPCD
ncbi:MAG: SoxR reducing system RseC family protein [Zoogloeaceae bacterium]|jgi:sigma-E factor negative regulatory protein RseC|nr:SoxR reducing system RseC family protein [Zoogloeaceae bacterium]